jgi:tetratricopeptide (TPR) repeat protein
MAPFLAESPQAKVLKADIDLQEGRYQDAKAGYEQAIEDNRTWDNLARLAYFNSKMGNEAGAEQLYIEAKKDHRKGDAVICLDRIAKGTPRF